MIVKGLSVPHSPRWYREKLWLLNSGQGEFGYVDLGQGVFVPVTFCPGYLRGLAFQENYAIVGLSKLREDKSFSPLPFKEKLEAQGIEPRCGLLVIDIQTGKIAHWLLIENEIEELYDVAVLPGVTRPMAIGFESKEIQTVVKICSIS